MPQTTQNTSADMTWKALGDPARRGILDLLQGNTRTTTAICESFGDLSRFQVMGHLSVLRDAGLIKTEKKGRERVNALDTGPMRDAYEDWLRKYEVEWAGRLGRLKRHVEQAEKDKAMDVIASPDSLATIDFERDIEIAASASAIFKGLTDDIGEWFGAPYLQTGEDAMDMVLDAKPGGKWLEITKAGEGAVWGEVQEIRRDRTLAIEGRMGMRPAVFARLVFKLTPNLLGQGTMLRMAFKAVGHFTQDHEERFTEGMVDLFGKRLKDYAEGQKPTGIRAQK